MYPASIVFDGFAMNITLVSYGDSLDFGIIACRRSMPQIQRIIDHLEEALAELEEIAGIGGKPARRPRASKTAPKSRTRRKSAPATERQAGSRKTKTTAKKAPPKRKSTGGKRKRGTAQ